MHGKVFMPSNAKNILIVEDNAIAREGLAVVLRRGGHEVAMVENGLEAIEFLHANPAPHVILLDMHLPKYNGEEILKCLRSTERYAQIPVVVMTSSDAPADHDRAQKHAAMFYFRKPSRLDEFIQLGIIVRDILTGKKPLALGVTGAGKER